MNYSTIGAFLAALEGDQLGAERSIRYLITRAIGNLEESESWPFLDPMTSTLNKDLPLTDDFVRSVSDQIEVLTRFDPMSPSDFSMSGYSGSLDAHYEECYKEADRGLVAIRFLDQFLGEPYFATVAQD